MDKMNIESLSSMGKSFNYLRHPILEKTKTKLAHICMLLKIKSAGQELTHLGRETHIHVSKLTIIVSDNGLAPGRCQAIIWTKAGIMLIRTLGTNFSETLSEIHPFSNKKMHLKISSAKWRQFNALRDMMSLLLFSLLLIQYLHSISGNTSYHKVSSRKSRNRICPVHR